MHKTSSMALHEIDRNGRQSNPWVQVHRIWLVAARIRGCVSCLVSRSLNMHKHSVAWTWFELTAC